MFSAETYQQRRQKLSELVKSGLIYFPGNNSTPKNYAANEYNFRQDSSFLYYFGIDEPGLDAIVDIDNNRTILFGDDRTVDDAVWMGFDDSLAEKADLVGVDQTAPAKALFSVLDGAVKSGQVIHFLPQYRAESKLKFEELLGIKAAAVNNYVSKTLIKSVVDMRNIKSSEEIAEMEKAVEISYEMNTTAMKLMRAGLMEREIAGTVEGITLAKGQGVSFHMIFSVNGQILHNHHHNNIMLDGKIAVLDSGAESDLHYASDITRTIPVSGKFTQQQKDIYNLVLQANINSFNMTKAGTLYRDCHFEACRTITNGLKELGIMKGDTEDALAQGAHALFMPHGLGHAIGLDVHDMEGLGEDFVGYDDKIKRSDIFGTAYLRFGKELKTGMTVTNEPGIYFIPQLIDLWKAENKFTDFINYNALDTYRDFGGIRLEDDVLVTDGEPEIIGKPIPKIVEEVEAACSAV